ncbi:MAG: DUF1552 domain-containing protein [Limisphaerales bacterium]
MNRRHFLQTSSLGLALPLLESVGTAAPAAARVKRFVAVGSYLGFHTPSFFPKATGADYAISPVLQPIEDLRSDFTLFSGLDHRALNGHKYWSNYLTGRGSRAVSVDQMIAAEIGDRTRFASLQVTCGAPPAQGLMSFTKEGIGLPCIGRPSVLFSQLFSSDSDKARMEYLLDSGRSVLDVVMEEAKSLQRTLSKRDREKLDEYFTSVRSVEVNVKKQRKWLEKPTPQVDFKPPKFDPIAPDLSLECESLMYELIALALETDSTRVVSFVLPGSGQVFTIDGERLGAGYHGLSHHGNDPVKIAEFNKIGREHVSRFGDFVRRLKGMKDPDGTPVLDSTAVLYGSGMGNANTHNNSRLPVLVAGGGFKHGTYHAIDRDNPANTTPKLGDVFITLMQSLGLEADKFVNARRGVSDLLS